MSGTGNFTRRRLHGSSHYELPGVLRWFTANIGMHHVHHLCSRIPYYRLPRVLRDYPGARRHRPAYVSRRASGVCGWCCGTKVSSNSSPSVRCVSVMP